MKIWLNPKTVSWNSSAHSVLGKYEAQLAGFHIFQIGNERKGFSYSSDLIISAFLEFSKTKKAHLYDPNTYSGMINILQDSMRLYRLKCQVP